MGKFIINKGDYIDSRQFTRKECERFCEIAVECGFRKSESYSQKRFDEGIITDIFMGVYSNKLWYPSNAGFCLTNNITKEFREFLDKEKGISKPSWDDAPEWATELRRNGYGDYRFLGNGKITYKDGSHQQNNMSNDFLGELIETRPKQFAKADLKDGMRVQFERINEFFYVCGGTLQPERPDHNPQWFRIPRLDHDLRSNIPPFPRIQRVIDRDGTVLFEREEELKELTLQQIADKFRVDVKQIRIKE